jgi:hypothetical protein
MALSTVPSKPVNLEHSGLQPKLITIADATGKTVASHEATGTAITKIPLDNLANGVYFINIDTQNGVIRRKITIAR